MDAVDCRVGLSLFQETISFKKLYYLKDQFFEEEIIYSRNFIHYQSNVV